MANKRGRKRKNDLYFGPDQEQAVLKYLDSEDELERNWDSRQKQSTIAGQTKAINALSQVRSSTFTGTLPPARQPLPVP